MQKIFFILGSHPALSVAEICTVFALRGIKWKLITLSDEVFVVECVKEVPIDIEWFGGVVKFGRIIAESDIQPTNDFGFSVYRGEETVSDAVLKQQWTRMQKIGMEKKRSASAAGHPTRLVVSRERYLSSVIVAKEIMRRSGNEFVWIVLPKDILVGQTIAVQAFDEYGARDFGRPGFDARSGMLPPKVAKIMVNLAQPHPRLAIAPAKRANPLLRGEGGILDPFCGSGTILQEALLLGYNVIGSDKSPSAIKDSKRNLQWLQTNYELRIKNYELFISDVRRLPEKLTTKVDAIVTEPYLGPALRKAPTEEELAKITNELTKLYIDAFRIFEKCLNKDGRVCIVFPTFVDRRNQVMHFLSPYVLSQLSGWRVMPPIPQELAKHSNIHTTPQGMLLYGRPGQKVWREIGIFERKN